MIDFFNNINLIRKNWTPSKKWESELCKNEEKDKILIKQFPPNFEEREYAKQYGKTVLNVIDKLDQQSISKSTDALIAINTIFSLPTLLAPLLGGVGGYLVSKTNKALQNQKKLSAFNGAMIGSGLYFIINQFISSQLEKETTRIARFQARNNELKDISNFVITTNSQNETLNKYQPQVITENAYTNLKAGKTLKSAFKTLKEMKTDYKQYKEWKNNFKNKEIEAKKSIEQETFENKELREAQKARNKITNTIYKLELAANNEEINFQYAIDLIQFVAKMSGAALATLLCFAIPKTQIKTQSNLIKNSKLLIPFTIPIFSLYLTTVLAKFQKDSAKLGRYEKKKELFSNENNFITFDDAKKKNIDIQKDFVENKKPVTEIINNIKSIKTMPKRLNTMYSDYKPFNKEVDNKNIELTENQIQDARLLQKQLFYSFEKIDEKSEGFTDDMDVLLKTAKMGIGTAVNVGFNIYALNLLTQKLKNFNGQKMPEFLEGLKLMKNLKRKDMISIFIIPYVIKSTLCVILDSITAHYRKKTNRVGVMTAINDLKDERVFTSKYLNNIM